MKREKIRDKNLCIRLAHEELEFLEAEAKRRNRTKAEIVRDMIADARRTSYTGTQDENLDRR